MSSDKFMKHFPDFRVTPIDDGLKNMVKSFKGKQAQKSNL
jgi:hypothetical protein